jgi:YD repeat-containing protein
LATNDLYWQVINDGPGQTSELRAQKFRTLEAACAAAIYATESFWKPRGYKYRSIGGGAPRVNYLGASAGPYSWSNWGRHPRDSSFKNTEREFWCNLEYKALLGWATNGPYTTAKVVLRGTACSPNTAWDADRKACTSSPQPCESQCCFPSVLTHNSIDTVTGQKLFSETDYQSNSAFSVSFVRYYNSTDGSWSHNYAQRIMLSEDGQLAMLIRPYGARYQFTLNQQGEWSSSSRLKAKLVTDVDNQGQRLGWRYVIGSEVEESYDVSGRLIKIQRVGGLAQTLSYDSGQITITELGGGQSVIGLDAEGRFVSFKNFADNLYQYRYEANTGISRLLTVIYPGSTPAEPTDNPRRIYHYENKYLPMAITGITDENGYRISTVVYDDAGRAILSERAGGAERVTVEYNADHSTTITNTLGRQTTYHFTFIGNRGFISRIDGHPTTNCSGANKAYTYTAEGWLKSKTEWNGYLTTYDYNERGLEVSRTEAVGTPQARTVTTEWHSTLFLPVTVTEPSRITRYTYDDQGRQLSQSVTQR